MRVMITDVTEMGGGNYCVAGWDSAGNRMVRPLPNCGNWPTSLINQYSIAPGVTIDVQPLGVAGNGDYPHSTEDLPIAPNTIQVIPSIHPSWFGPDAPGSTATVNAAFGNHVLHNSVWNGRLQGVHVLKGTQARSLWAVAINRANLTFVQDFQKLKAILHDGQESYNLSISAAALKERFRQGGVQAVVATIPQGQKLHVRLGLARAWDAHPNKCFLMINGVLG